MPFPIDAPDFNAIVPELAGAAQEVLGRATPTQRPWLVHTLGGPGSGKTRFVTALNAALSGQKPLLLAFDRLMEVIPAYKATPDRAHAFADHEMAARMAGYALLREAMAKGCHIIFEHSGARADHIALLRFAKEEAGYHVAVVHLHVTPATAHHRLSVRQEKEGRFTPPHYVEERTAILDELAPLYRDVADHWLDIDNDAADTDLTPAVRALCNHLADLDTGKDGSGGGI